MHASPPPSTARSTLRFACCGDIHCTVEKAPTLRPLFEAVQREADALLLCGDLTDYGLAEEAHALAHELGALSMPVLAVLGNHDFEAGRPEDVRAILEDGGVRVLDGEACEVLGVGIAGAKGFAGGFGRASLGPWGEPAIKLFVKEAIDEALKLESALAKLRTPRRIAMLHYAPVVDTVQGEPPEIFAFLGSSRLEEPLLRYPVDVVVHGHAHRGALEGRTVNRIPVYNVAKPLLERCQPGQAGFKVVEMRVPAAPP